MLDFYPYDAGSGDVDVYTLSYTPPTGSRNAYDVFVNGNLLYVADYYLGLEIFNMYKFQDWTPDWWSPDFGEGPWTGHCQVPHYAMGVTISGFWAYVTSSNYPDPSAYGHFSVVDVQYTSMDMTIYSVESNIDGGMRSDVHGNWVAFTSGSGNGASHSSLRLYKVAEINEEDPYEEYDVWGWLDADYTRQCDVLDSLWFTSADNHAIDFVGLIDVTSLANLLDGTLTFPSYPPPGTYHPFVMNSIYGLDAQGDYIYLMAEGQPYFEPHTGSFTVVSIRDGDMFAFWPVATYIEPTIEGEVVVDGNVAYVAGYLHHSTHFAFASFDITNPASPYLLDIVYADYGFGFWSRYGEIEISGDTAFVSACEKASAKAGELREAKKIEKRVKIKITPPKEICEETTEEEGDSSYTTDETLENYSLMTVDISDPSNLRVAGYFRPTSDPYNNISIALDGDELYALVLEYIGDVSKLKLESWSVKNPLSPELLDAITLLTFGHCPSAWEYPFWLQCHGDYLFFAFYNSETESIEYWYTDITDPTALSPTMFDRSGFVGWSGWGLVYGDALIDVLYTIHFFGIPTGGTTNAKRVFNYVEGLHLKQCPKTVSFTREPVVLSFHSFPTPWNSANTIRFTLARETNVKFNIYNIAGERILCVFQGMLNEGEHTFTWDGTGENGERLASGCYFYCIEAEDKAIFSKTVLIR